MGLRRWILKRRVDLGGNQKGKVRKEKVSLIFQAARCSFLLGIGIPKEKEVWDDMAAYGASL